MFACMTVMSDAARASSVPTKSGTCVPIPMATITPATTAHIHARDASNTTRPTIPIAIRIGVPAANRAQVLLTNGTACATTPSRPTAASRQPMIVSARRSRLDPARLDPVLLDSAVRDVDGVSGKPEPLVGV
ncbi:Uncharacterised protein [Mycobacteroides abscessus subsp. abscessus]|nr:Uncharacterised protein [Mycobacteroides abscessus subsp. abscessus]